MLQKSRLPKGKLPDWWNKNKVAADANTSIVYGMASTNLDDDVEMGEVLMNNINRLNLFFYLM